MTPGHAELLANDHPAVRTPPIEAILLGLGGAFVAVNTASLSILRSDGQPWVTLLVWAGCAAAGYALLNRRLPRHDPLFFPLAMFLAGWGVLAIAIGRLAMHLFCYFYTFSICLLNGKRKLAEG